MKDKQKVAYDEAKPTEEVEKTLVSEHVFLKGTSKRIWGELYKVIDSSDVVLEVPWGESSPARTRQPGDLI